MIHTHTGTYGDIVWLWPVGVTTWRNKRTITSATRPLLGNRYNYGLTLRLPWRSFYV